MGEDAMGRGGRWARRGGRWAAALLALALGPWGCATPPAQAPGSPGAPASPAPSEPARPTETAAAPAAAAPSEPAPTEDFSMSKSLEGVTTIDDALRRVKEALAKQGFGIITQIDVQAVMKTKLGLDRPPYWILGACNPEKANRAVEADPRMGLLLPCKVVVYQDEKGAFVVAFARPSAIFGLVGRADLAPLADEVDRELRAAFDAL